jgi:hypothetical protein
MFKMQGIKSTDPRDKVYAFLGLKPAGAAPDIIPDYRKSTAQIYTDTALSFIKESKSLQILGLVEGNENLKCCSSPIPNLPTWAPNWSQKFHGVDPMELFKIAISFRSSRDLPYEYIIPEPLGMPPSCLIVKGKVVTTIRRVLPLDFAKGSGKGSYYFNGIRTSLPVEEVAQKLDPRLSLRSDMRTEIFRTLLADGARSGEQLGQPLKYPIPKLMEISKSEADIHRTNDKYSEDYKALQYFRASSLVLQKRLMFEAAVDGFLCLGLGNLFIQSGDVVCILYGAKVPMVIREFGSHTDPAKRRYKVICQCYLDGWMYGDSPEESWWGDFEQRPVMFTLI